MIQQKELFFPSLSPQTNGYEQLETTEIMEMKRQPLMLYQIILKQKSKILLNINSHLKTPQSKITVQLTLQREEGPLS